MMPRLSTLMCLVLLMSRTGQGRCPRNCSCDFQDNHKRVTCESGGLLTIPTAAMDTDIKVLVITAPQDKLNDLNLGRIFQNFRGLEEVRITRSRIPAIGDSSFWPGKNLQILDLSNNNITDIKDSDFNGLSRLQELDLSYNNIGSSPSAPFRFLTNLRALSLARNKFQSLVSRLFFMLTLLEHLDLSGNPLRDVDPENLKDLRPLKRLNLSECHLTRLHSLFYQQLPNLEELDLSSNRFANFAPEEFRHLRGLRVLNLRDNKLRRLAEKTFDGHRLDRLDLGHNRLTTLAACTFCNTTVKDLDLSGNLLKTLNSENLAPVAHTLRTLDISQNPLNNAHLSKLIRPLTKLKWLSMVDTGLAGELPPEMFQNNFHLTFLNLSRNKISNVTGETLAPMTELVQLDLSHNGLGGLYATLLGQLKNMTVLTSLLLHHNPWNCERCHVEGLMTWMRQNPFYRESCVRPAGPDARCLRCFTPAPLAGKELTTLSITAIPSCVQPVPQSQVLVSNSQVGLAVGVFIIVSIIMIILIVIIMYRRHGAVYYTHEDGQSENGYYGSRDLNNGGSGEYKKHHAPVYVTSLERIDENTEVKTPVPRRNSYL